MSTRKEDFASRWSRLKRENQEPPPASSTQETEDEIAAIQDTTQDPSQETEKPDSELSDSELLEKYELPDPATMKAGDDFSAFMKSAIPDRLRRRALRVLWGSNPILANLDELVDYGEDFTDAATVVENMQTIYQVGKGASWKFKEEQERLAAERAAEEAEAAERRAHNAAPEDAADEPLALEESEEEPIDEPAPPLDEEPVEVASAEAAEEPTAPLPPKPRPMRFQFD